MKWKSKLGNTNYPKKHYLIYIVLFGFVIISMAVCDFWLVCVNNEPTTWKDVVGEIRTHGNKTTEPDFVIYKNNIMAYEFEIGDEAWTNFQVPYDYMNGTDIYLHFHWSTNSATVTGGTVTWKAEVVYTDKYGNEPLAQRAIKTTQNPRTTQYQQMISEVQLSSLAPNPNQFHTRNIKHGGIIMVRAYLYANNMTDRAGEPKPFLHFIDIHYQATVVQ